MNTTESQNIVTLVLKAVAVGMPVASIVLGFIPSAGDVDTQITLLSIGLAALAIAALHTADNIFNMFRYKTHRALRFVDCALRVVKKDSGLKNNPQPATHNQPL